jgi:hypothetical protein
LFGRGLNELREIMMRKGRKAVVGVAATMLLAAVAFSVPAGAAMASADGSGSPVATQSKKKCKKKGKRASAAKKKCKKRGGGGAAYAEGRYSGTFSTGDKLYFSVLGGRLFTEGRDTFAVSARCSDGSTDYSTVDPVEAFINPANGSFAGSGNMARFENSPIPWTVSGLIAGTTVSSGTWTAGPYLDYYGNVCSATANFTAQWCLVPTSCVFTPSPIPIIIYGKKGTES